MTTTFVITPQDINDFLARTQTATFHDGHTIGYNICGDPTGRPVFYFHGGPGSRLEALAFHASALKHGFRLIAPDRPGHGASDYQPGRTLLDWPHDLLHLADHLKIDRFGVIGASSGGPPLLACALAIPGQLTFAIDLAGAAPVYRDPQMLQQLGTIDRFFAKSGAWLPAWLFALPFSLINVMAKRITSGEQFIKFFDSSLCAADQALLHDPNFAHFIIRDMQESFRQGARGPADDALLIYKEWGFTLDKIRQPVHIFHGTADRLVPFSFSEYVHSQLPQSTLTPKPAAGHYYHFVETEPLFEFMESVS